MQRCAIVPSVSLLALALASALGCSGENSREPAAQHAQALTAFAQPSFRVAGYTVFRVGPSDAASVVAYALNGSNEVVGGYVAGSNTLPFVQHGPGGVIEALPAPHPDMSVTVAAAIGNNGFVAGTAGPIPLRWSPAREVTDFAYSAFGLARAVNSNGLVVGHTATGCGMGGCTFSPHAWDASGTRITWPAPAGAVAVGGGDAPNQPDNVFGNVANDVTEGGLAVGQAHVSYPNAAPERRALLWSAASNTTTDLGNLGAVELAATGLNERGDLVGARRLAEGAPFRGFVWLAGGSPADLPCDLGCTAYEINQARQVVGSTNTLDGEHAFVWSAAEGLVDLDDLLVNGGDTVLRQALDINDLGSILVKGVTGDQSAYFLLVPESPAPVYWYYRCNATGWDADSHTLMLATETAGVFSLAYDVTLSWMLDGGDQCLLARTNARNGWGTEQRFYGVELEDSVAGAGVHVPDSYPVFDTQSSYARLVYPALGRYRAILNTATMAVSVEHD